MAATDPKKLHWPPISTLWHFLYNLRNGAPAEATPASGHLQFLHKYNWWLAHGLTGWQPASFEASKALEAASGQSLDFGLEKLTVFPGLLLAANALSKQLVSPCAS